MFPVYHDALKRRNIGLTKFSHFKNTNVFTKRVQQEKVIGTCVQTLMVKDHIGSFLSRQPLAST
jgi:hypothetical protein